MGQATWSAWWLLAPQTWTRHHAVKKACLMPTSTGRELRIPRPREPRGEPEGLVAFPFSLDPGRLAPLLVRDAGEPGCYEGRHVFVVSRRFSINLIWTKMINDSRLQQSSKRLSLEAPSGLEALDCHACHACHVAASGSVPGRPPGLARCGHSGHCRSGDLCCGPL